MTVANTVKLTIGSTTVICPLARGQDGRVLWSVGEIDRGAGELDKELRLSQTDWRGGFGQGTWKDPSRYADGSNIDTTQEGLFYLGPLQTVTYVKRLLTAAVADDGGVQTTETTGAQNATAGDMTLLPGTPQVNDAYYFLSDNSSITQLDINITQKGVGTWTIVWEYYSTAAGDYAALAGVVDGTSGFCPASTGVKTVTFTNPGADWATQTVNGITGKRPIRARVSAYTSVTTQPLGGQAWMFHSSLATSVPGGTNRFVYHGSGLFVASGVSIYEWDNTNAYWWERKAFSTAITDLCSFNGYLFVALGNATAYEYTSDGDTYTASSLSDNDANYFMVAPSGVNASSNLWKVRTPNEVTSNASGLNDGAQWTTPYYIGDTSANITGIMLNQGQMLIGRTDNLFYLRADGITVELMPELEQAESTNNFKYHVSYQGGLYFSLGSRLGEIDQEGRFRVMGPLDNIQDINILGNVEGLSADRDYLYCLMYTNTSDGARRYVFKGRVVTGDTWAWCPILRNALTGQAAYVAQIGTANPRLWVLDASNTLSYVILSDDPLRDSAARFSTTAGYIYTSWFDAGVWDWDKLLQAVYANVKMNSGSLSATKKVTISYATNDATTWTAIDTAYTSDTLTKKYTDLSTVTYKKVRFKIQLDTDDNTKTPIVRFFTAYGQLRPERLRVFDFTVENLNSRTGESETVRDFLNSGRDSTALITMVDRFGASHYVVFLPGYPIETEIRQEAGRKTDTVMQIRAMKVDWS